MSTHQNEPDAVAVNHLVNGNREEIGHYLKAILGDRRKVVLALAPDNAVFSIEATQEPARSTMRALFEAAGGGPLIAPFPVATIARLLSVFDQDGSITKKLKETLRADQGRLVVIVGTTIAIQAMTRAEVEEQAAMNVARTGEPTKGADAIEMPNGDYGLSALGTLKLLYNMTEGEVGSTWSWVRIAAFQRYVKSVVAREAIRAQPRSLEEILAIMAKPIQAALNKRGRGGLDTIEALLDKALMEQDG